MGKYGGSWAKGFASTFDPVGGINLGLQWKEKKAAKKKIDDAVEQLKTDSVELATMFDNARADGKITQQEHGDAAAWALPLGKEMMGRVNDLYSNFPDMTPDQLKIELENIDAMFKFSEELDFTNLEQMKEFGSKLTQTDAKMQWDLVVKSIEGREIPKEPAEEAKEPTISDYNTGLNYLRNIAKVSPENWETAKKGLEKKFGFDYSKITRESLIEPISPATTKTPTPTSFKTIQDIKDSFKHVKTKTEYDSAVASYNTSKEAKASEWTPPSFEKQLVSYIKEVEEAFWADFVNKGSGKLKNKNEAETYNKNLQNYLKLIEEAKNAGIDVSQFQAFISYGSSGFLGLGDMSVIKESW